MATNVTWNGTVYSIPAAGEVGWSALSSFLIALGNDAAIAQEMKQAIRVATTSPVTVSNTTDCVVAINRSSAAATAVTLPAGTDGRWFVIVDQKADAATNNITITPNGAETINGSATYVINQNNEGVILAYSATNTRWNVVGRFTSGAPLSNPMSSAGDMIYGASGGSSTRLATGGTAGVLHGGNAAVPSWSLLVDADVSASAAIAGSKLVAATASVAGAVSTTTQSFAGAKTFTSSPIVALATGNDALVTTTSGASSALFGVRDTGSGRTFVSNVADTGDAQISLGFGAITSGVPANPIVTMDRSSAIMIGDPGDSGTTTINGFVKARVNSTAADGRCLFQNISAAKAISSGGTGTFDVAVTYMNGIVIIHNVTNGTAGLYLLSGGAVTTITAISGYTITQVDGGSTESQLNVANTDATTRSIRVTFIVGSNS